MDAFDEAWALVRDNPVSLFLFYLSFGALRRPFPKPETYGCMKSRFGHRLIALVLCCTILFNRMLGDRRQRRLSLLAWVLRRHARQVLNSSFAVQLIGDLSS